MGSGNVHEGVKGLEGRELYELTAGSMNWWANTADEMGTSMNQPLLCFELFWS